MKAVDTMTNSLQSATRTVDARKLTKEMAGYVVQPTTKEMKHGRAQEPHANCAMKNFKRGSTKLSRQRRLVWWLWKITSSLLPAQMQWSIVHAIEKVCKTSDLKPSARHLPYLFDAGKEGQKLKMNHQYYFQVQGQIGVCGLKYCDFFVYTSHGFHLERIVFDKVFWMQLLTKLRDFWQNYVRPELLLPEFGDVATLETEPSPASSSALISIDHGYSAKPPLLPRKAKANYRPEEQDLPAVVLVWGMQEGCCQRGSEMF